MPTVSNAEVGILHILFTFLKTFYECRKPVLQTRHNEIMTKHLGFDTLKVRGGYNPAEHNRSVAVPIYQTTAFELGDVARASRLASFDEFGFRYSRLDNPTSSVLEQRVAALDGAVAAVAVSSGMAAVTYSLLNTAEGGGRILTTPQLYGGTVNSFKKIYPKFGVEIDVVTNADDPRSFESAIREGTRGIFVESISNPNAIVADIEAIAEIAHAHGIPLIVDNTFATPYLLNPIRFGADVVVYSATKGLSGHGNIIGGLIVEGGNFQWANGKFPQFMEVDYTLRDSEGKERSILDVFPQSPFTARIRKMYVCYFGASLSPFEAYLALLGIETLSERVRKQVESTEKLVRYLEQHAKVSWVKYPSAKGSPYGKLAAKYLPKGAGSVFTFGFKGTIEQSERFIDSVKLFSYHANLGDVRSLIVNVPKTTHRELMGRELSLADIPPETIRLSIGLEEPEDLIADLDQAFAKSQDLYSQVAKHQS
jgi:O-acetylhomoserine (thiol)-lyase